MITMIVKGTKFEAARAAADRGIPFVFFAETKNETAGKCAPWFMDKVAAWFMEPGKAPYPPGALLLYREDIRL